MAASVADDALFDPNRRGSLGSTDESFTRESSLTSVNLADVRRTEVAISARAQRLEKVTKDRRPFSSMVVMQYTVEHYLLTAKYASEDEVIHAHAATKASKASEKANEVQLSHFNPYCYKLLRAHFRVDVDDYYRALCCTHWHQPPNSNDHTFFAGTHYVVTVISPRQSKALRRIIWDYHKYIVDNPKSTLPALYGHHEVKQKDSTLCFVVSNNVFPLDCAALQTFQISGSSAFKPAALVDFGFSNVVPAMPNVTLRRSLGLTLLDQLKRDIDFLMQAKLSHYTLVVGLQQSYSEHTGWEAANQPRDPQTQASVPRDFYQIGIVGILDGANVLSSKYSLGAMAGPGAYAKKLLAAFSPLVL